MVGIGRKMCIFTNVSLHIVVCLNHRVTSMEKETGKPDFLPEIPPPPFVADAKTVETGTSEPAVAPVEKRSQSLGLKILFIALISLGLLIPDLIIMSLIGDRERTQNTTVSEISSSWSGEQLISGPIVTIPYDSISPDDTGGKVRLLPESLDFNAEVKSQTLHRGIYESVVYNADVKLSGDISLAPLESLGIPMSAYRFKDATVTVGIGDLKGVEDISSLDLSGKQLEMEGGRNLQVYSFSHIDEMEWSDDYVYAVDMTSGSGAGSGCMEAQVGIISADTMKYPYSLTMKLRGSRALGVTPIGRHNDITIAGDCKSPSFKGMFLPSEREVADGSFKAEWTLNSINRDYPQAFIGDRASSITLSAAVVDMLVPVDRYQKTDRAVKYAIIVVLLTFIAVLFAEIVMHHPIHVFQYLLIGLALILFYSLLLSLSEHISFGCSYLVAAVMTIGLIFLYMKGVLHSLKVATAIAGLLVVIYAFIYMLLCLETFALLTGSIGLFIALAVIMYATLKLRIENR